MLQNIVVVQRAEVAAWLKSATHTCPYKSWALISIWGSFGDELVVKELFPAFKIIMCSKALSLRFDDISDKISMEEYEKTAKRKMHLFNKEHADSITKFVTDVDNNNIETLVVQCAAGISRSGAVGLWACRYFGMDEDEFRDTNKHIAPNFYILKILNEVSGVCSNYVKAWKIKEDITDANEIFV